MSCAIFKPIADFSDKEGTECAWPGCALTVSNTVVVMMSELEYSSPRASHRIMHLGAGRERPVFLGEISNMGQKLALPVRAPRPEFSSAESIQSV